MRVPFLDVLRKRIKRENMQKVRDIAKGKGGQAMSGRKERLAWCFWSSLGFTDDMYVIRVVCQSASYEVLALEKEAKAAAEMGRLDKAVTAAADAKMHSEPLTNVNFMVGATTTPTRLSSACICCSKTRRLVLVTFFTG